MIFADRNRRAPRMASERAFDLSAGSVPASVQHARHRVRPLHCQVDLAVQGVEVYAKRHQFTHTGGALGDHGHHGMRIAQTRAGDHGVFPVQDRAVVRGNGGRHATLGIARIRLREPSLGQDQNGTELPRVMSGIKSRDAAADDNVVVGIDAYPRQSRLQVVAAYQDT